MKPRVPLDLTRTDHEASSAWARALRLHGHVANDNGRKSRLTDDDPRAPELELVIAQPDLSGGNP